MVCGDESIPSSLLAQHIQDKITYKIYANNDKLHQDYTLNCTVYTDYLVWQHWFKAAATAVLNVVACCQ